MDPCGTPQLTYRRFVVSLLVIWIYCFLLFEKFWNHLGSYQQFYLFQSLGKSKNNPRITWFITLNILPEN